MPPDHRYFDRAGAIENKVTTQSEDAFDRLCQNNQGRNGTERTTVLCHTLAIHHGGGFRLPKLQTEKAKGYRDMAYPVLT